MGLGSRRTSDYAFCDRRRSPCSSFSKAARPQGMARPRTDRTYRVRQLQLQPCIDYPRVTSLIASLSDGLGPAENIQIFSLASSLPPSPNLLSLTATVTFSETPSALDNDQIEWSFPARHLGWRRNVIFDTHFLGFTALNDPNPDDHDLECVQPVWRKLH